MGWWNIITRAQSGDVRQHRVREDGVGWGEVG